jgi:hypothetical protein
VKLLKVRFLIVVPWLILSAQFAGGETMNREDTVQLTVSPPDTSLFADARDSLTKRYSAFWAGGLALAIPGAGQVYTHHPIKGVLLLGAEAITGLVLLSDRIPQKVRWEDQIGLQNERSDSLSAALTLSRDSLGTVDSGLLKVYQTSVLNERLYAYRGRMARYSMYHNIGWLTGLHLWNIMDALQNSRRFDDDEPRNPVLAGCLSLIPGLALGQIYNGSLSKAGMIWMTQTMLIAMAFDYNRLLQNTIDERAKLLSKDSWENAYQSAFVPIWDDNYDQAFMQRNMYLWYGLFFYLYAIFDAVVDANLHDYRHKIRLDPVYERSTEAIGLQMTVPLSMRGDPNKRKSVCR